MKKGIFFLLLLACFVVCTSFNGHAQDTFTRSMQEGMRMADQMQRTRILQEQNQMEQIRLMEELKRSKLERERFEYQKQLYELEIERQKLELENKKLELELQKSRAETAEMALRELTDDEKKYLVDRYKEKGKKLKIGKKLETIKVYDQGFVLPYECVVDGKEKTVVYVAFERGKAGPSQFAMSTRDKYLTLMKQDNEFIQKEAVGAFSKIYRQP